MIKKHTHTKSKIFTSTLLATSISLAGVSGQVLAQNSVLELEEVLVTASKRSTTLQETPIAVSVVNNDLIEKSQILDLKDLQSVVPSLRINQLQNSTNTNFIIRGFGNGANNPGIEPSVGVFIDGVYRSRSASSISDLPNLERVEVLRGPQSTLFGKNASAGVISIVTRKPDGESRGKVSATIGNYNQRVLKGQVEGSISDNVFFDLAANTNTRDGYLTTTNPNTGDSTKINDRDRQSVRGQLFITPSDNTEVRIIADWDKIDENCCGVNNFFQSDLEKFVNSQTGAQVIANNPLSLNSLGNFVPTNQITNRGLSVQVDHDFESFSVTSITSKRHADSFFNIDADFTSADYITNPIDAQIDTFTQELRFTSLGGDNFDWMVGLFYFDEQIDHSNELTYGDGFRPFADALTVAAGAPNALAGIEAALGLPVGLAFFNADSRVREEATLDNQAASLFGQFDYHFNDKLTATVGLNYTRDKKQATLVQTHSDAFSSVDLVQLGFGGLFGALSGGLAPTPANFAAAPAAFAQAQALSTVPCSATTGPACNSLLGLQALQFLPPAQAYPNEFEDGRSNDKELTYTVRLSYDMSDDISFYAGVSTGFKASSWNLSRDSKPVQTDVDKLKVAGIAQPNLRAGTRFAAPEEATVVEFGMKARFERGSFNLAIFDQSIKNFQSNVFVASGFNLANAEKQSTQGIEFDLTYYPTDDLRLTAAGTLLDPVYDKFTGAAGAAGPVDLSGRKVAGVHETSLSFGAAYTFTIGNSDAYVNMDYQWEDKIDTNDNLPRGLSQESARYLNMSAGLTTQGGIGVALWARNLTDHATVTTGFPTVGATGGYFGYRNQPRTYGATLSYEF